MMSLQVKTGRSEQKIVLSMVQAKVVKTRTHRQTHTQMGSWLTCVESNRDAHCTLHMAAVCGQVWITRWHCSAAQIPSRFWAQLHWLYP